jgi:hypothetical protein
VLSFGTYGYYLTILTPYSIVLPANWGGDQYAWNSAVVIALFIVGGLLFIAFIAIEFWVPDPIMPFKLFNIRNVLVSNLTSFMIGYPMFGLISTYAVYLFLANNTKGCLYTFKWSMVLLPQNLDCR